MGRRQIVFFSSTILKHFYSAIIVKFKVRYNFNIRAVAVSKMLDHPGFRIITCHVVILVVPGQRLGRYYVGFAVLVAAPVSCFCPLTEPDLPVITYGSVYRIHIGIDVVVA